MPLPLHWSKSVIWRSPDSRGGEIDSASWWEGLQSHLARGVHTRREGLGPLLLTVNTPSFSLLRTKDLESLSSVYHVPCPIHPNLVTSTLDICLGCDCLFFSLPHSHPRPRNNHLFLGLCFCPFVPVACSQYGGQRESNFFTSLLRHPPLASKLTQSKSQHLIMANEVLHDLNIY